MADRSLQLILAAVLVIGFVAGVPIAAEDTVKLDSYAEWRVPGALVVDGQRVTVDARTTWKGKYTTLEAIPLGDEVRVEGVRTPNGSILAREIDVRPNGSALFESEVQKGTDELEGLWLRSGEAFEADGNGRKIQIGEIEKQGVNVDRVQRLVRRLKPNYVDQSKLRVYVIHNKEWNAMAMGNGAIWVFKGIMDDMRDEELAIVVGHELAHYTHEHSRRQARKNMWIQMGAVATLAAAEAIDSAGWRALAQLGSTLGFTAWRSGYGRDLEDQADRVGMRYAHEGGFDVSRAPDVWGRFLKKYGNGDKVTNFFFSDHSRASSRQKNLQQEIKFNYAR
jgi:Zn-dependent protease with chaperone function